MTKESGICNWGKRSVSARSQRDHEEGDRCRRSETNPRISRGQTRTRQRESGRRFGLTARSQQKHCPRQGSTPGEIFWKNYACRIEAEVRRIEEQRAVTLDC